MVFNEELPRWENEGASPPEAKKDVTGGWEPEEKPPAGWFNWFWNRVYSCLEEIRTVFNNHSTRHENAGADEISIAGLQGESAELSSHKSKDVTQANRPHGVIYEEGTFTPAIMFGNHTYTAQDGSYIRQNNKVSFRLDLRVSDIDRTTNTLNISGLPFTIKDGRRPSFCLGRVGNLHFGNDEQVAIGGSSGSTFLTFRKIISGKETGAFQNDDFDATNNDTTIFISGTYEIE